MPEVVRESLPWLSARMESSRLLAVKALADSRTMEGWRELLGSYADQPPAVRAAILRRMGEAFGYRVLLNELPEYSEVINQAEFGNQRVNEILSRYDQTKDLARVCSELRELEKVTRAFDRFEELRRQFEWKLLSALRFEIDCTSAQTKLELVALLASRSGYFDPSTRSNLSFKFSKYSATFEELFSILFRKAVKKYSIDFVRLLDVDEPNQELGIALAELRNKDFYPLLLRQLKARVYESYFFAGHWPTDECLKEVLDAVRESEEDFMTEPQVYALKRFDNRGPRGLLPLWSELGPGIRREVLEAFREVLGSDTFRLVVLGSRDESRGVRLAAISTLAKFFGDSELIETTPSASLSKADRVTAEELLKELSRDSDEDVSSEARQLLEELQKG